MYLIRGFHEDNEKNETARFDYGHHKTGLFETKDGQQENTSKEATQKSSQKICSVEQAGSAPQCVFFRSHAEIDLCCQRILEPNRRTGEKGHDQKPRIDKKREGWSFKILRRDGEHKWKEKGEEDNKYFHL